MASTDSECVRPVLSPPHLGELIRQSTEDVGWTVGETAARLNCERAALPRVLNGKTGASAKMILMLEGIDWGAADHRMHMQAAHALVQACPQYKTSRPELVRGREAVSDLPKLSLSASPWSLQQTLVWTSDSSRWKASSCRCVQHRTPVRHSDYHFPSYRTRTISHKTVAKNDDN